MSGGRQRTRRRGSNRRSRRGRRSRRRSRNRRRSSQWSPIPRPPLKLQLPLHNFVFHESGRVKERSSLWINHIFSILAMLFGMNDPYVKYKFKNTCCFPRFSCQLRDANRSLDMVVYRCGMAMIFADYWRVIRLLIAEDMLARLTCIISTSSQAPLGRFFFIGRDQVGYRKKSLVGAGLGRLGFHQVFLVPYLCSSICGYFRHSG